MNIIPKMTHPLSSHWHQPNLSEIAIDDNNAMMNEDTLNRLHEYSYSIPSGVYEGKMWKRVEPNHVYLMWYGPSEKADCCSINNREILLIN